MSKRIHYMVSLLLIAVLLLLTSSGSFAQDPGVRFKLIYQNGVYTVSMTPEATPEDPNLTLSAAGYPQSATWDGRKLL